MGKAAAKLCNHNTTTLMEEVCQGMELARQLGTHLHNASSTQTRDLLVKSILSSYDKALKLLKCNSNELLGPSSAPSESPPPSGSNSPKSDASDSNKDGFRKHGFKKRKTLTQWTEHVRVCGEAGPEGPLADGYSWRKYGQKDILGASFPRGYYRCTHRHVRGCLATKQVQRSDRDPSVLDITYRGRHTCSQAPRLTPRSLRSPPPAARVEAKTAPCYAGAEVKIQSANPRSPLRPPCSTEMAVDFGRTCQVNSEDVESKDGIFPPSSSPLEDRAFVQSMAGSGGFLPAFLPPAMSESDYFLGGWDMPGSESDLPETNSEPIAVAVSPNGCLDFPMDPVEFDPNFSFDALEFFT